MNNKIIAKNTIFLYVRMLLIMLVSLYTSRVVLDSLGIDDFGIYNIVGGIISLFAFINGPMIEATQRFLNFYMGRNDKEGVKNVFNASLVIHIIIALIIVFFAETIGLWFLHEKIVIPENRFFAACCVYHISIFSTVMMILSYPYNALIIAHEQMSIFAYISIFEALSKLLIAFLILSSPCDRLVYYALLIGIVHIIITLMYFIYCNKKYKETQISFVSVPNSLYKDMLGFTSWNFLGNIASVCLSQGTNILLNIFFGPAVNAAKGISVQVQNAVNQLSNNFQIAFKPQIIKSYSSNELKAMHSLIFRASKFSFFLTYLLALPIMYKTYWILSIWLKEVPCYTIAFVRYTMLFALIQSLATPLLTGSLATGRVKKIMLYIASFFIMVIPISYIALLFGGEPTIVFLIQLFMYFVAHIIRIIIVSKQIFFGINDYCKDVIYPIIVASIPSLVCAIILNYYVEDSFVLNLLQLFLISILNIFFIYYLGISKVERHKINQIVINRINNIIK
ncbi:lipopolysaccharide biosynthesis protein [Prevotella sp. P2-180]|uniref:lipopolysaccharide biosynthesis protein n=1 Tax=Prevotella sp. P2-180 TaxID=2024224 RepID=UPI000B964955|nr:hypothetical protein [Prevotella sp. P2-180]